jgi:bifunctional non-homologous end joining protein LigD
MHYKVSLTHPDKLLYPDDGITKEQVFLYYETHAELILPYIKRRPITIVRCPEGSGHKCFYQKHWDISLPPQVHSVTIKEQAKTSPYLVIDNKTALLELVQLNAIEFHPWPATVDKLNYPNQMIFDLDPAPEVAWPQVIEGSLLIREQLDQLKLKSWIKLTGGKGLHIVVPVHRNYLWAEFKLYAQTFAKSMVRLFPDRFVSTLAKSERTGKIFIDYLRNSEGATAVAPYSLRAKPGAPVAQPIAWDDLPKIAGANAFNIFSKVASLDPWRDFFNTQQSL